MNQVCEGKANKRRMVFSIICDILKDLYLPCACGPAQHTQIGLGDGHRPLWLREQYSSFIQPHVSTFVHSDMRFDRYGECGESCVCPDTVEECMHRPPAYA